jgi:uncharacterized membrane protein
MKISVLAVALFALISCSGPKFAYQFDTHRYQSASKNQEHILPDMPPVHAHELVASAELVMAESALARAEKPVAIEEPSAKIEQFDNSAQSVGQQKPGKKAEPKKQLKSEKSANMDHDLKLAAIFGAVGVVGILLGGIGDFFLIIGGIALLIGVVFFVKWLIRQ